MKRLALLIITFLALNEIIKAQEVSFTVTAPDVVELGQTFRVVFTLNADGENFRGPDFKGFNVVSGPNVSQSSSFQFINGKMHQEYSQSYTYLIHASMEGVFDVKPATITVRGKTYQTQPFKIQVTSGSSNQPRQASPGSGSSTQKQTSTATEPITSVKDLPKDDIFIRAYVSNPNPYAGEQTVVTYKLYTKVPLSNIRINNLGTFPGFWSQDLLKSDKLQQSTEIINGEEYVTAEIKKTALFGLKPGTVNIPAMEMECIASIAKKRRRTVTGDPFFDSFFNDAFFNAGYEQQNRKVYSNALKINVKPLPADGKPANYTNAVGNFTLSAELDRNEVKANDALNLRVKISGTGNLDVIEAPQINFPTDFDTYEPKVTSNINTTAAGVSGSKTFEYLLIPRNAGTFTIKPITFSFFNPTTGKYSTLTSPEFTINVAKGEGTAQNVTYSGVNQQDLKYIGSDIRYIKLPPLSLRPAGTSFFASRLYYGILVGLLILFAISFFVIQRILRQRGDTGLMRLKKATGVATKRLKNARNYLNQKNEEAFYNETSAALWGYISDKFNIPLADLSMENVEGKLTSRNVNTETIRAFIDTLNNCEFARFAPGNKAENMEQVYQQALETISRIERELK
ncbi:MAG: BatD family protein [Bacteroidales bacterium]